MIRQPLIKERVAATPHRINKERRRLVLGTIAGAGLVVLSPVEQAYAAVETVASLGDRRNKVNVTSSHVYQHEILSHDAQNNQSRQYGLIALADATPSVQGTPTVDPTVTALQKELLEKQIEQLNKQNFWSWTNIATPATVLIGLGAGIFGYLRWRIDQRNERIKREKDLEEEHHKRLSEIRAEYMRNVWRRIEDAVDRDPGNPRRYNVEKAIADIQLFGSTEQVKAVRKWIVEQYKYKPSGKKTPIDLLLLQLRSDLRKEIGLGSESLPDEILHLRFNEKPPLAMRRELALRRKLQATLPQNPRRKKNHS